MTETATEELDEPYEPSQEVKMREAALMMLGMAAGASIGAAMVFSLVVLGFGVAESAVMGFVGPLPLLFVIPFGVRKVYEWGDVLEDRVVAE